MRNRLRPRLTYANLMATVAVFIALGGGAYATSRAPDNSVDSSAIINGQVKRPDLATGSVNSANVADGSLGGADVKADSLGGPNILESSLGTVPSAANAGHAATADNAANATHAATATDADHAANSDQLAGAPASAYQSRVAGDCGDRKAISSINSHGAVNCARAVLPINGTAESGSFVNAFGVNPIQILVHCHRDLGGGPETILGIFNMDGSQTAKVGAFYGTGGAGTSTSVNSYSLEPNGGSIAYDFAGKVFTGQFVFAIGNEVWTLSIFAEDDSSSCPIHGTAEYAHL